MRAAIIPSLIILSWISSCKNKTAPESPVTVSTTEIRVRKCVVDTQCAEIKLAFPVVSGGKEAVTRSVNDTISAFVRMVVGGDPSLPIRQAADSAVANLHLMLEDQLSIIPDYSMGFVHELTSKNLVQNSKVISFELSSYSFTGGAHGNYGSALFTFRLDDGALVQLTDIIQDTASLRPLLETGFVESINARTGETYTLADLVFPESIPLPMPLQWCIVREGVRFTYNPYEVAAYAVGQTDIILTWEKLGKLADKSRWID